MLKFDRSNSLCPRWLPYSVTECAVEKVNAFTVLVRNRGTNGDFSPTGTVPEVLVNCFVEDYFSYCDAESSIVCYRVEVLWTQANVKDARYASPAYCFEVNIEIDWDLTGSDAAAEPLKPTV